MICIEIANDQLDAYDWVDAEIEVDRIGGAAAAETWTFVDDYSGASTTSASAYEVILSLYSWLNSGDREWRPGTASWSYAIAAVANDYIGCTFTPSADTWDVTPNAAFTALTGVAAIVGGTSFGPGAWDGAANIEALLLRDGLRREDGPGVCSPGIGYLAGCQSSARRPLRFEAILTDTQQRRVMEALEIASSPRRAYIYDPGMQIWRWVALGLGDVTPTEAPLYARWAPDCWRLA